MPISIPSGILVDPSSRLATIHQRYRQDRHADEQDRQDNRLIGWGEPFYKPSPQKENETKCELNYTDSD